jgi:hypothetical protein
MGVGENDSDIGAFSMNGFYCNGLQRLLTIGQFAGWVRLGKALSTCFGG